jgi:hypothetical protein
MGWLSDWWQRRRQTPRRFSWIFGITAGLVSIALGTAPGVLWHLHNIEQVGIVVDARIATAKPVQSAYCKLPNSGRSLDCIDVALAGSDQRIANQKTIVSLSLATEVRAGHHLGVSVQVIYRDNAGQMTMPFVVDDLFMLRREAWWSILVAHTIGIIGGALATWDLNRRTLNTRVPKRRSLLKRGLALRRYRW